MRKNNEEGKSGVYNIVKSCGGKGGKRMGKSLLEEWKGKAFWERGVICFIKYFEGLHWREQRNPVTDTCFTKVQWRCLQEGCSVVSTNRRSCKVEEVLGTVGTPGKGTAPRLGGKP